MRNEETLVNASREHLNRFIDDLRKELVLTKMHLSEANSQIRTLMERLGYSEKSAESLRQDLVKQQEMEAALKKGFEKALSIKEREIEGLKLIIEEKGKSSRKLAERIHAQSLITETEKKNLRAEHDLINSLRKEILKLGSQNSELESMNKRIAEEFNIVLKRRDDEVRKLKSLIDAKDGLIERMSFEYNKQIAESKKQRAEERIPVAESRGSHEMLNAEIVKLRMFNHELGSANREVSSELGKLRNAMEVEVSELRKMVSDKENILERLSDEYSSQISAKDEQIANLNKMIKKNVTDLTNAEKYRALLKLAEEESKNLASDYNDSKKQISDLKAVIGQKDSILMEEARRFEEFAAELNKRTDERINEVVMEFAGRELKMRVELESARAKLSEQETFLAAKQKEIDSALDNFASATNRILGFKGTETDYLLRQKEIADFQKQLDLRAEQLSTKEVEVKGVLEGIQTREKALSDKEREISNLLNKVEERTSYLAMVEDAIKKKEELLMMQQQAFQKELAVFEQSGFEFKEIRKEEELNAVPTPVPETKSEKAPKQIVDKKPQPKILRILKPKQVSIKKEEIITKAEILPPPPAIPPMETSEFFEPTAETKTIKESEIPSKIFREGLPSREELFGKDREGFSEIDEISSIIEVARSHGDSDDAIKSSLINSGYSKDRIEEAFRKLPVRILNTK